MNPPGKIRALLATARVANIPSVASNVWCGVAIAALTAPSPGPAILPAALQAIAAGILLYLAGNFLNDHFDRQWDAAHRPERALPRGLFTPASYLAAAVLCAVLALVAAFTLHPLTGLAASAIAAAIVIYTLWHKRSPFSVIPMGLCRALLPVMGFLALSPAPPHLLAFSQAAALLLYIAGLSLSARYESMPSPPAFASVIPRGLLPASGFLVAVAWMSATPWPAWLGLLPFAVWISLCLSLFRKPVPAHVSALLAGIPLLDWIGLLSFSWHFTGPATPFTATCLLLPPIAFAAGRSLQRLAPAT